MTRRPAIPPPETEVDDAGDMDDDELEAEDDSPLGLAMAAKRDPVVNRWIRRFRKLAEDMPPSIWVFVASGTPTVCATGKDGMSIHEPGGLGGGVDRNSIVEIICGGMWDGGDW